MLLGMLNKQYEANVTFGIGLPIWASVCAMAMPDKCCDVFIHQQLVYISLTLFSHTLPNPLLVVVNFVFATLVSGLIAVIISKSRICKTVYGYR